MNRSVSSRLAGATALAILLSLSAGAEAADMDSSYPEASVVTPVEYGSGWYLRGDIGVFHGDATGSYGVGGNAAMGVGDWGSNPSLTVGAGYIFNDQLRADVTLNYKDGFTFAGSSNPYPCGGAFTGDCWTTDAAEADTLGLELAGYWTPIRLGPIAPYVGAGVGLTHIRWDDTVLDRCRLDPGEDCSLATNNTAGVQNWLGTTTRSQSFNTVALSTSLMAGFDYRISDRWTADLGYKYTHIQDIGQNDDNRRPRLEDASLHEVRIGFRYEIW